MNKFINDAIAFTQEEQRLRAILDAADEDEATTETSAETGDAEFIDRRFDPHWVPTPAEARQLLLDAMRAEISQHVRLDETTDKEFWNRFRYDDATMTIEVRPEFSQAPWAVSFHFGEGAQLKEISGPGADSLQLLKDVDLVPEESPYAFPNPYAPPRPKR